MPDEMDDYAKSLDGLNADDLGPEDQFGEFYQRRYSGGVVVLDNQEDDQLSDTGLVEKHRLAVHKILHSYIGSDVNPPRSITLTYLGNCNYKLSFVLVMDESQANIRPYLKLDAVSKLVDGYWIYDDGKIRIAVEPTGHRLHGQLTPESVMPKEYTLQRSIIVERNGQIDVLPKGTRIVIETYDDSYLEVRNPNGSHREARKPLKKPAPKPAEGETTADTAAKVESEDPDTKRQ